MPPKHDLRGGRASDDSFAMSNSIFVALTNRCFFAAENCEPRKKQRPGLLHELGPIPAPLAVGGRFFGALDILWGGTLALEMGNLDVRRCRR